MTSIARSVRASVSVAALVGTFVVVGGMATLPEITARAAGDWKPLFNGHDFGGWVVPAGRGAAPGALTALRAPVRAQRSEELQESLDQAPAVRSPHQVVAGTAARNRSGHGYRATTAVI